MGIFQVGIFWVRIFQGGNSPEGNLIGGNFPGGDSPGGNLMDGNFPGGSFSEGNFPDTMDQISIANLIMQHYNVTKISLFEYSS